MKYTYNIDQWYWDPNTKTFYANKDSLHIDDPGYRESFPNGRKQFYIMNIKTGDQRRFRFYKETGEEIIFESEDSLRAVVKKNRNGDIEKDKPQNGKKKNKGIRFCSRKSLENGIIFFIIQCTLYSLLVVNYRSVVEMNYTILVISDFVIASFNFFVIRKIASSSDSLPQWIGYALGGAVGGVLGLWISTII